MIGLTPPPVRTGYPIKMPFTSAEERDLHKSAFEALRPAMPVFQEPPEFEPAS